MRGGLGFGGFKLWVSGHSSSGSPYKLLTERLGLLSLSCSLPRAMGYGRLLVGEKRGGFRDAPVDAARFVPVFPPFFFQGPSCFHGSFELELLVSRLVDAAVLKLLPFCFFCVLKILGSCIPCLWSQKSGSLASTGVWSDTSSSVDIF